ncbi:MAG: hypothetical protein ACO33A_07025 [Hyphomonas sp.]
MPDTLAALIAAAPLVLAAAGFVSLSQARSDTQKVGVVFLWRQNS